MNRYLYLIVLLGGFLYAASMPGYFAPLAFVALVPWGIATQLKGRKVWRLDYLFFVSLFWFSVYWIGYVSWVGAVIVVLVESAMVLPLGWIYRRLLLWMPATFALPIAWTFIEFLRIRFPFDGLPFGVLGSSQYQITALIQCADVVGVEGISFFVAMVNGLIVDLLLPYFRGEEFQFEKREKVLVRVVLMLGVVMCLYGLWRKSSLRIDPAGPTVAIVQGQVASDSKGQPEAGDVVFRRHMQLSEQVLREGPADLLIWSESSFPWPLAEEKSGVEFAEGFDSKKAQEIEAGLKGVLFDRLGLRGKTSFLGGFLYYTHDGKEGSARNAAVSFSRDGNREGVYFKQHLVPGGEYVPAFGPISWIAETFAGLEGFRGKMGVLVPGNESKVFPLQTSDKRQYWYGISICYDNAFAGLYQRAVEKGAQFHIVLSNEAWYGKSNEFEQLLAASVFRAIETRRSFVRVTNSGISCVISPLGEIRAKIEKNGEVKQIQGTLRATVPICAD